MSSEFVRLMEKLKLCRCHAVSQSQATGLLAKATNLLSRRNTLYVTRVVENLCTSKPNSEDDTYLYLDPKVGMEPHTLEFSLLHTFVS